jgi:hypothetical protein
MTNFESGVVLHSGFRTDSESQLWGLRGVDDRCGHDADQLHILTVEV